MKAVIDSCSLVNLCRYYFPFDTLELLFKVIKERVEKGEMIIIDKIRSECRKIANELVFQKITYLYDQTFCRSFAVPYNTDYIYVLPEMYDQIDRDFRSAYFVDRINSSKMSQDEIEKLTEIFINSPDMTMILVCKDFKTKFPDERIILITDETENPNDKKDFKKIPAICEYMDIETWTIVEYLDSISEVRMLFESK